MKDKGGRNIQDTKLKLWPWTTIWTGGEKYYKGMKLVHWQNWNIDGKLDKSIMLI